MLLPAPMIVDWSVNIVAVPWHTAGAVKIAVGFGCTVTLISVSPKQPKLLVKK